MQIGEVPAADVRGSLTAQRGRLLSLLTSLSDAQWAAPTAAPEWPVKDIALHLLDVDLSWLAHGRDHDRAGIIPVPSDHEEFVRGLAQRNQRWVDGTRILSPRLITDLLRWSGEQLDAYLGTVDLAGSSSVYWAGEVPLWFDLAREFTERWVHYRQIREAAPASRTRSAPGRVPASGAAHVHMGLPAPIPSSRTSWHHDRPGDSWYRRMDPDPDSNRMDPQ